nr:MAG TPA_asm: hypothetical protein [Caudoviricetes sp.]
MCALNVAYLKRCWAGSCSLLTVRRRVSGLGLGASNLYSLGEGQRAGPTVCKKTESNRVLTCIGPSLLHHYLLFWDFLLWKANRPQGSRCGDGNRTRLPSLFFLPVRFRLPPWLMSDGEK